MKSSRRFKAAVLATAVGGVFTLAGGLPAQAAVSAGAATIVSQSTAQAMPFGGSHDTWTIKLPAQARCTGDSATGAFFIYSFLTPAANNPLSLTFSSSGPSQPAGSFAFPLVDTSGSPYIAHNTAVNTGQVIDFPATAFNFAVFTASGGAAALPAGLYNLGIACSKGGVTDNVWSSQVRFTTSACDNNGELWAVPPATNPTGPHAPSAATGLSAAPGSLFAVNLSWRASTDRGCSAVSYQILRGTAAGAESLLTTVSGTSFTDSGHTLDILTTFYYKVVAVNSSGSSAASNEAHSKAFPWSIIPL